MVTDLPICRFCFEEANTADNPLWRPCNCRGGIEFVHRRCLLRWIFVGYELREAACHLCKAPYSIPTLEQLERIPGPPLFYDFLLRNPLVIFLVIQYNVAFVFAIQEVTYRRGAPVFFFLYGHSILRWIFWILFCSVARTRNLGIYLELWFKDCMSVVLVDMLFYTLGRYVPLVNFMGGAWLAVYWDVHKKILLEINRRLLE
jgi:hypothetical protein